ncbi:MAG: hypothetical protein HKN33_15430 [Pyrinomonadaceae bacterium]|nr:hypothetical protein [Pyrinomonadaceae bacterium]
MEPGYMETQEGQRLGSETNTGPLILPPNENWEKIQRKRLRRSPFKLNQRARTTVRESIYETCEKRKWELHAENVRTNHVHIVVDAGSKKGKAVRAAFKANATRALRESGQWNHSFSPWSGKGSIKSIWDLEGLVSVIDYVRNEQGDEI